MICRVVTSKLMDLITLESARASNKNIVCQKATKFEKFNLEIELITIKVKPTVKPEF